MLGLRVMKRQIIIMFGLSRARTVEHAACVQQELSLEGQLIEEGSDVTEL